MQIIRYFIAFIILFFSSIGGILAFSLNDLKSDKVILYNMNEDTVLYEKKADIQTSIASLTKIMTVIVAIENIEDLNKKVKITNEMISPITWDVATAGFKVGDIVTYEDLLYGAILPSGADATNALAISISGSFDKYVSLMNKKVKDLDLKNTSFKNVTGLDTESHYSTARDMSTILKYALKSDTFKKVYTSKEYTTTNGLKLKSTTQKQKSKIESISLISGAKTGYTTKAQQCLASISNIDGVSYLLVTLNASSKDNKPNQILDAVNTYKYYSTNYSYQIVIDTSSPILEFETLNTKENKVSIYSKEKIEQFLKNDFDKEKIKYEYKNNEDITSKIKPDTVVGVIKITYENNELAVVDAIIKDELHFSVLKYIKNNPILIFLTVLIILFLFTISKLRKHKRKYKIRYAR